MEIYSRDFKGVWIPKNVWLDNRLTALDKIILCEINSLDVEEKGCWASNKYLAEFCKCSETKVSTSISKLIKIGYVYKENFDGRSRVLKVCLSKNESLPFKNLKSGFQNLKESNIIEIYNRDIYNIERDTPQKNDIQNLILEYTGNEQLRDSLNEFVKMRKLIKKPLTKKALKLNLSKLDNIGNSDQEKILIVNQSIEHSWQSFYELNSEKAKKEKFTESSYDLNEWERYAFEHDPNLKGG